MSKKSSNSKQPKAPEMEILQPVFNWLCQLNILQDGYVAKKKKGSVFLNQQAVNAVTCGHVFYYVCYNVLYQRGQPLTQQLTGNPGEALASQAIFYNWTVLCDIFGTLGLSMSTDYRDLLAGGDVALLVDLLNEMYNSFSGEQPVGTTGKKSNLSKAQQEQLARKSSSKRMLKKADPREGAVSVDQGLEAIKAKSAGRRTVEDDLLLAKEKFRVKKMKEAEEEAKKQAVEEQAKERAKRISERIALESRLDLSTAQSQISAYRECENRGVVQFCHSLVLDLCELVESGEAQAKIAEREKKRSRLRQQIEERKKTGHRLVDTTTCPVHVPRKANHKTYLLVKSIVEQDIVELAMQPDCMKTLLKKEKERAYERNLLKTQKATISEKAQPVRRSKKYAEQKADEEEEERRKQAAHESKMARLREENKERAKKESVQHTEKKNEMEIEAALKAEKDRQKDAMLALYYAEQKAKVTERARQRQLEKEQEAERKLIAEKEERIERQRRGQELNAKIREKRLKKLQGEGKMAAPSLSPVSYGTGDHAAYFGETLGWQYLTETEFDLAQVLCQVRADPSCASAWIDQRLGGIKGRALWLTDDEGRRLPMSITEGPTAHEEALEYLSKMKPQPAPGDVSIGLTLAARHHAIDLAYHAIADSTVHTGTDGTTLTQRVLKYGTPALRPGHSEVIFAVVRPTTFRYNPADILASMIVDDGNLTRDSRGAIFHPVMVESIGVGHAIANLGEKYCVEVVVFLLAFSFIDKPVAWMSQSHHSALDAVAAPFLAGSRSLHSKFRKKRDIYTTNNLSIGRANDGNPDVDRLYSEKLHKRQHQLNIPTEGGHGSPSPDDDDGIIKVKAKPKKREPSLAQLRAEEEKNRKIEKKEKKKDNRLRLARFYAKYAGHKIPIIDAALTMYEGKEEEMFFALIRKYGPEPGPDEDVDLPDDWQEMAAEYAENHREKQKEEQAKYEKFQESMTPKKTTANSDHHMRGTASSQNKTKTDSGSRGPSPTQRQSESNTPLKSAGSNKSMRDNRSASPGQKEERQGQSQSSPSSKSPKATQRENSSKSKPSPSPPQSTKKSTESGAVDDENDESILVDGDYTTQPDSDEKAPTPSKEEDAHGDGELERQHSGVAANNEPVPLDEGEEEDDIEIAHQSEGEGDSTTLVSEAALRIRQDEAAMKKDQEQLAEKEQSQEPVNDTLNKSAHSSASLKKEPTSSSHADDEPKSSKSPKKNDTDWESGMIAEDDDDLRKQEEQERMSSSLNRKSSMKSPSSQDSKREVSFRDDSESEKVDETKDISAELADEAPPTEEELASQQQDRYRRRLERLYAKYAPQKMDQVDKMMKQYEGKEESMFRALTKKYGPEPEEEESSTERLARQTSSASMKSNAQEPDELQTEQAEPQQELSEEEKKAKYRRRLENIYAKYAPQKMDQVDKMMKQYEGKEESMLRALVKKYGPEPEEPVEVTSEIPRTVSSLKKNDDPSPERQRSSVSFKEPKDEGAEPLPEKEEDEEGMKADQRPPLIEGEGSSDKPEEEPKTGESAQEGLSAEDAEASEEEKRLFYRKRLTRLYEEYAPQKLDQVDKMLDGYKGREESMFRALVKKYGPEPAE